MGGSDVPLESSSLIGDDSVICLVYDKACITKSDVTFLIEKTKAHSRIRSRNFEIDIEEVRHGGRRTWVAPGGSTVYRV